MRLCESKDGVFRNLKNVSIKAIDHFIHLQLTKKMNRNEEIDKKQNPDKHSTENLINIMDEMSIVFENDDDDYSKAGSMRKRFERGEISENEVIHSHGKSVLDILKRTIKQEEKY